MQITAETFTDPSLRPQLEQYYEQKKAAAIESLRARDAENPSGKITFKTADGTVHTGSVITAEQMEKSIVSFDKWLEFQSDFYERQENFHARSLEMMQRRMEMLEQNKPDSPSGVRSTFSADGALLAYVTEEGYLVTSNGAQAYLGKIAEKANDLGLSGQRRIDYLNKEIEKALTEYNKEFDATYYDNATMPSKREFAQIWYPNHDVDTHYEQAVADAKASFESAKTWHDQWQRNMNEIRDFLIGLQEAA